MQHLVIECAVRAALIAAGTAAVLRLLQVKSAAARHLAWAGVVVLMLLLPVWMAWGPKASLRVLPPVTPSVASRAIVSTAPSVETLQKSPYMEVSAAPAPRRAVRQVLSWWTCLALVYLLGVCVLLARLTVGTVRAHVLVKRAAIRNGKLTSSSCAAPVTVGWLRCTVILPECWPHWPQAQLDAVLAHEGEHARRHHPLVQWLALMNRAVFWFHPLAWWLERRLSSLAEEACDAAVLARGHDPLAYSEYLLEIARAVLSRGARVQVLGMAMPGSALPRRIRRILEESPAQRISRARMVCMVMACAMVSAVFATGAVDRRTPEPVAEPVVMVQALPVNQVPAGVLPYEVRPKRTARVTAMAQVAQVQATQAAPEPQTPPATQAAPAPQTPPATAPQKDRRLVVLYFDLRAMPAIDRARAFASAQTLVRKMQSSDLIAIITANDAVKVWQDFTGDTDRLLQTLDRLVADSGSESSAAVDVDLQLIGLQTAVNMLGSLKEKKAMVYFAEPADRTQSALLRPLIDAAIRAYVAFYTIDVRGLIATGADVERALAPDSYTIGAEDLLQLHVSAQEGISGQFLVRADGMISMPLIGAVKASGLTTLQLQAVIADRLEAYIDHPSVTVIVVASHRPQ